MFQSKFFKLSAQLLEPVAVEQNKNHQAHDRNDAKKKNFADHGVETGVVTAENYRLGMLRSPQAVGDINERSIQKSKNAKNG